jgi:hypothetical protein
MAEPVKFRCTLKRQTVEVKTRKEGKGEDAYEVTDRIGKLALEFDADRVDIAALAKLVDGEEIWIGLDRTQMSLFSREPITAQ